MIDSISQLQEVVIIGDIHGRSLWKDIVKKESDAAIFVFLGDYFDSKDRLAGAKQLVNFIDITEFKKSFEKDPLKKVVLIFGNHDYHYMPWFKREPYSGYLPYMALKYRKVLMQHFDQLQIAWTFNDVLFTHAGLSLGWLKWFFGKGLGGTNWEDMEVEELADFVNDTFKKEPKFFDFNGFNPFGDDPNQPPTWVRPWALKSSNLEVFESKCIQVFGHTVVKHPSETFSRNLAENGGRYFHADMLGSNGYLKMVNGNFELKFV